MTTTANHPATAALAARIHAAGSRLRVSGADYLVNDVRDRHTDALHPTKSRRPIAAGLLSPNAAVGWAAVLWSAGSAAAFAIDWRTGCVVVAYIALMLAYSFYLKFEVILDVMVIASGFVFSQSGWNRIAKATVSDDGESVSFNGAHPNFVAEARPVQER